MKFGPLDINDIIKDVFELSGKHLRNNHVSVTLELLPDISNIRGDRLGLEQVLMNLINNSLEAMRESSSKNLTVCSTMQSSDMVAVSIRDSGTGIDGIVNGKVFDPFFSTRKNGMGMGLRICRSIVEDHGGRIWFKNNHDAGTTFSFSLKVNPGEPE